MNFTKNPLEKLMKERPHACAAAYHRPPPPSPCCCCSYWQGASCLGMCYRELMLALGRGAAQPTSGQRVPK